MTPERFEDLTAEEQDWIDGYLDGTIEPEAFEALQERLVESAALRKIVRRYSGLHHSLQVDRENSEEATAPWLEVAEEGRIAEERKILAFPSVVPLAAAAAVAFLLGLVLMYFSGTGDEETPLVRTIASEPSARGFAVIEHLFEAGWPADAVVRREGELLGAEVFRLASGLAEIQFFSGATMTVEGPATISLKSAWEAACHEGKVKMLVPPAARGFKLQAPSTEIIDLGTEFGLVVRDGKGHVEVFDGEIALQQPGKAETLMTTGTALALEEDGSYTETPSGQMRFPDKNEFGSRAKEQLRIDFARWVAHRDRLAKDERLIAYYTFDQEADSLIPNQTLPRNSEYDGAVILAEPVDGRWPGLKSALEFRRPGARVRVNVPGEFPAFTFMAWVRIDSLDRWYNALFMGDSYETGEPHWQIREDGAMMLSVMVDDTRPNPGSPKDAGWHRVYFSPPMWDLSMSGEWLHLASVYDPEERRACHYVNGEKISEAVIEDAYFIDTLRIGNGEIGNWGQPFREEPTFAIRNLNGRMDELAMFRVGLSDEEIADLYRQSRAGRG